MTGSGFQERRLYPRPFDGTKMNVDASGTFGALGLAECGILK